MDVDTNEIVAVLAAVAFAVTLGLMVVVAIQPSKGVLGKVARFLLNKLSIG